MRKVLVVEDDSSVRETVATLLEVEGYEVDSVATTSEALQLLAQRSYPIIISDIYLDERSGLDILRAARRRDPNCAVILMTGRATMETVMEATEGGAFDYLAKPFDLDQLLSVVRRAEQMWKEAEQERATSEEEWPETEMIGSSPPMVELYKTICRVAPTDATVLIEGETGTGKELVARLIHKLSPRAGGPFIPVDCAAIPASLLESELFGAVRGAYTGADRDRIGLLEAADRGTVLLDEIGDVDLGFQLKLLRFVQERQIRPVGSARSRSVDVRVLAATNQDLQKLVEEGKFRQDLWYRLNVVRIRVPPLRERIGDIRLLARHFLRRYNERYGQQAWLTESGLQALESYRWPGNVRQLQHLMERLCILAPHGRIDEEAVRSAIQAMEGRQKVSESLAEAEAEQIRRVLAATRGNKSQAAKILGIERKTLYRKLEKMGLLEKS